MFKIIACAFLSIGIAGIAPSLPFLRNLKFYRLIHFSWLGLGSILMLLAGGTALLKNTSETWQLPLGIFNFTWDLKLDALAGFFLALIGTISAIIAFYGPSYVKSFEQKYSNRELFLFTALFVASMSLVVLAANVITFMLAWELLSLSSYFLVAFCYDQVATRQASFIYLLMAHLSGLFILGAFAILSNFADSLNFNVFSQLHLSSISASLIFGLFLIGFGIKAGLIPLHIWLPKAHPIAPAHISALLSGVMLKIAVYGFIRCVLVILHPVYWQWGMVVLLLGAVSAVIGILSAMVQRDLKCLLAYSSIENIGIIFMGLGLTIIFIGRGYPLIGALGLIAVLYHSFNHALFKSLLFLGAGSIVQQTHEHDLENMGGLIHKMPQTALWFLVGCLSLSALPPFNGFCSEWLIIQTSIQSIVLPTGILRFLLPIVASLLALTSGLAAACLVKVYGIAFLGKARSIKIDDTHEPSLGARLTFSILAISCLCLGILPAYVIKILNNVSKSILNLKLDLNSSNWLWLKLPVNHLNGNRTQISIETYAPLILAIFLGLLVCLAIYWFIPPIKTCSRRWDCGFGKLTSKMQYTATAFAMPIRRLFKPVWYTSETLSHNSIPPTYKLNLADRGWIWLVKPISRLTNFFSKYLTKLQSGNVRWYLGWMFGVLIILLWLVA